MFADITGSIKRPFTKQMPLSNLALYFALFLILAWIAYDGMRIVSSWLATVAEA